jgi:hypothetical protein
VQLPWDEHFYEIVISGWQAYLTAEQRLTEAVHSGNEELSRRAGYDTKTRARTLTVCPKQYNLLGCAPAAIHPSNIPSEL